MRLLHHQKHDHQCNEKDKMRKVPTLSPRHLPTSLIERLRFNKRTRTNGWLLFRRQEQQQQRRRRYHHERCLYDRYYSSVILTMTTFVVLLILLIYISTRHTALFFLNVFQQQQLYEPELIVESSLQFKLIHHIDLSLLDSLPTTTTTTISSSTSTSISTTTTITKNDIESYIEFYQKVIDYVVVSFDEDLKNDVLSGGKDNDDVTMTPFMKEILLFQYQQQYDNNNNDNNSSRIDYASYLDISSMVELSYCSNLLLHNTMNWTYYLFDFLPSISISNYITYFMNHINTTTLLSDTIQIILYKNIEYEILLQLLEQYITMTYPQYQQQQQQQQHDDNYNSNDNDSTVECNYSSYTYTLPVSSSQSPNQDSIVVDDSMNALINHTIMGHQLQNASITWELQQQQYYNSNSNNNNTNDYNRNTIRIVYIISTYHDIEQLQRLIHAIYLPQHYIIIHIDTFTSIQYTNNLYTMIQTIIQKSANNNNHSVTNNIVIVQFGYVVYRTDSISMINLRILHWITNELQIQYNYVFVLDGMSYPLISSNELLQQLLVPSSSSSSSLLSKTTNISDYYYYHDRPAPTQSQRQVYLGQLLHNGQNVTGHSFVHRLYHKRLIYTIRIYNHSNKHNGTTTITNDHRTFMEYKLHKRLPKNLFKQQQQLHNMNDPISLLYGSHMIYKSTSGNQGIYSKNVISKLLSSNVVKQLFVLSKYSCCCCMEEHNWIAALHIIDAEHKNEQDMNMMNDMHRSNLFHDAYNLPSPMFQVWGGDIPNKCVGSMSNAILLLNDSLCYRSEDPYFSRTYNNGSKTTNDVVSNNAQYFFGNDMWEHVVHAKEHNHAIMARKFSTHYIESQQLIHHIHTKLWKH